MSAKKASKSDDQKSVATLVKKAVKKKKVVKKSVSLKQKSITETSPIVEASVSTPSTSVNSVSNALPSNDVTYVIIDYPTESETISGLHYAIRIGSSANGLVELSINNGPWESCRYADGYWWYDWGYYLPGPIKISARLLDEKGKTLKRSSVRKCTII
ncbi:MAG: hypothetical protein ABSH12_03140 [Endomicrobiales bacterium]|jgi:hypothetical protein